VVTVVAVLSAVSMGVASQQEPQPVSGADLSWAFTPGVDKPLPDDPGPKTIPGSTRTYTIAQVYDDLNPADWFPDRHPLAPQIVIKGHGTAWACGACHLMSGLGHPQSANLTGFNVGYIVQQLLDFRDGTRTGPPRMSGTAKALSDREITEAATYFSSLQVRQITKVIEAQMAPKTSIVGDARGRYPDPGGGREPLGNRIITVPEQPDRARLRDPYAGFIAYAPVGSLAKGKTLVETSGGKSVACTLCHGLDLKGQGGNPGLAGQHPIYTVRQLYSFKRGTRKGRDAALMQLPVAQLNDDDIIAIAAYLGSLDPAAGR
jgi:cytochrome c553